MTAPTSAPTVKMAQIVVAPFSNSASTGSSYSVLGLSTEGAVYRYDPQCEGWIPWSMTVANCRLDHAGKR